MLVTLEYSACIRHYTQGPFKVCVSHLIDYVFIALQYCIYYIASSPVLYITGTRIL